MQALGGIDRATNAFLTRGTQLIASARAPDELEASRWPFLARRALATHAPGSSHGEIVDPDAYAMSFWYDAALVVLLAEPYALDFVRHRCRQVARELCNLLPMLEPDPDAPAAIGPRPRGVQPNPDAFPLGSAVPSRILAGLRCSGGSFILMRDMRRACVRSLVLVVAAACGSNGGSSTQDLVSIEVEPANATLTYHGQPVTLDYHAIGHYADGSTAVARRRGVLGSMPTPHGSVCSAAQPSHGGAGCRQGRRDRAGRRDQRCDRRDRRQSIVPMSDRACPPTARASSPMRSRHAGAAVAVVVYPLDRARSCR